CSGSAAFVTGSVGDTVTLPCNYSANGRTTTMCWGRGSCPSFKCNNEIIKTDGLKVTWNKCERSQLLGNIAQGDVSLTISKVTSSDAGIYCCRVENPGWFNDIKEEIIVKIQE
ncbi:hepatitis A virus cellular receptor 1 homolog, partial [Pelobates cultripes]